MAQDFDIFEHEGMQFAVSITDDPYMGTPWENCEGHGPVSDWERRSKRPGELILCSERDSRRFYDLQEAMKLAKKEGWDAEPYKTGTKGEQAYRAVMADYEFLRRWCNDQWSYVGMDVALVDGEGSPIEDETGDSIYVDSTYGVENDKDEYVMEVARECADNIVANILRTKKTLVHHRITEVDNYWKIDLIRKGKFTLTRRFDFDTPFDTQLRALLAMNAPNDVIEEFLTPSIVLVPSSSDALVTRCNELVADT